MTAVDVLVRARELRPFTLPAEPVDRFEVRWYEVDSHGCRIYENRAVYHANTKWSDFCENDDRRGGADIVNQWMIYRGDFCTGRAREGWDVFGDWDWNRCYATAGEAREALASTLRERIECYEEKRAQAVAALAELARSTPAPGEGMGSK